MPELWLPIIHKGRRRDILIPFTHDIDHGQLDELIAWQKEKTLQELDKLPPKPKRTISKRDVGKILDDFTKYLRRKREDINPRYY